MHSQYWIIFAAILLAGLMAYKPEMFIPNPRHRTPRFVAALKSIGTVVAAVLLIWLFMDLFRR